MLAVYDLLRLLNVVNDRQVSLRIFTGMVPDGEDLFRFIFKTSFLMWFRDTDLKWKLSGTTSG